jgi:hypothetical protein
MTKAPDPAPEANEDLPATTSRWSVGRVISAAAGVGAIALGVAAVLFPRDGTEKKGKGRG